MKKLFSINIKTFLLKVFLLFFIGFASRIIIHHCLGFNVFLEYTNNIDILYYLGLSTFLVYFDQLFSYQYCVPTNVESNNINKYFNNDPKTFNLLFTKDHNNSSSSLYSTDHSSRHSKAGRKHFTTNEKHTYLRPIVNNKGDIILVTGLDIGKHSSNSLSSRDNSDSIPNMPPKPKPSNLSTPSTISPLFPNSQQCNTFIESYHSRYRSPLPSNLSHESQQYRTTNSKHTKSTGNVPICNDRKYLPKRYTFDSVDFADRRIRVIESVEQKIKESNINKPTRKTCILSKISSSLNYLDSHQTSKLFKQPTGNTDIISQEMAEEIKRKKHDRELERQAFYTRLS
jgi:hypothetical protein